MYIPLPSCCFKHSAQQDLHYLAPPWNLMLTLPTLAVQPTLLTAGRPISSLLMAIVVLIVSPFTFRSKEPLSFLLREREEKSLLQQKYHNMHEEYKEEIFAHLHYFEVLDPPVSMQTDEGVTDRQSDTSPRY